MTVCFIFLIFSLNVEFQYQSLGHLLIHVHIIKFLPSSKTLYKNLVAKSYVPFFFYKIFSISVHERKCTMCHCIPICLCPLLLSMLNSFGYELSRIITSFLINIHTGLLTILLKIHTRYENFLTKCEVLTQPSLIYIFLMIMGIKHF